MIYFRKVFRVYPKLRHIFYKHWNLLWFKLNGITFGRRMTVLNKIYIKGNGKILIGDDFIFTSGDCINPICRNIRGAFYTMTPEARIIIGDRVGISSACLWAKERITIGNDVNIGGDCLIMDNDAHPIDYLQRRRSYEKQVGREIYRQKIGTAPIEIGDKVYQLTCTAGSGDVLTGIILGLLAQGYPPRDAAILGVSLHAISGDIASEALGRHSLIASDLTDYLPQAFKLITKDTLQL